MKPKQEPIIKALKQYFQKKPDVVLAFLFGSRAKGKQYQHFGSDWDIGVYFKPHQYMEIATRDDYSAETGMWGDLVKICQSNDVDLVVLNRAKPSLVFRVLNSGIPLTIKNRRLYLDLLSKTHYEAVDWHQFVLDFWNIKEKARSFSKEAKEDVLAYLDFLEEEFKDLDRFKEFTWDDYKQQGSKRREIERWVENIVMSTIDIAKIILASEKGRIPSSYEDTLKTFLAFYWKGIDEETADRISGFAKLRNIVLHEYLDIKWGRIKKFVKLAEDFYPEFIKKVKQIVNE